MWARCVALGVEDALFWRSTPYETRLLLEAIGKRREEEAHQENLRFGLVAAAIYNNNPHRRGRALQAQDFVRTAPKVVSPEELEAALDSWAQSLNNEGG